MPVLKSIHKVLFHLIAVNKRQGLLLCKQYFIQYPTKSDSFHIKSQDLNWSYIKVIPK